jgi:hypothetical protein
VEPKLEDAPPADLPDAPVEHPLADEPLPVGPEVGTAELPPPTDLAVPNDEVGAEVPPIRDGREAGKPLDLGPEVIVVPVDGPSERGADLDVGDGAQDGSDAPLLTGDSGDQAGGETGAGAVDAPPLCTEQQVRSCSSPGNPLIGACRAGKQVCSNGAWDPVCKEEVLPAATETCNGIDDNCNGMTDEGCVEGCVVVAPDGVDDEADGTAAKPFGTLAKALELAAVVDGGAPRPVCVAGAAACTDAPVPYLLDAALAVPNGARVQGNYALANGVLTYCADTQPPTTMLKLETAEAFVQFGDGVTAPTEFSGFSFVRFSATTSTAGGTTRAVAIAGGKTVTLSGLFITDEPTGDTTYGVEVKGGGQATIVRSAIAGGLGKLAAFGVYVASGSVNLRDNCDDISTGQCQSRCENDKVVLGIRGRTAEVEGGADTSAIYLSAEAAKTSSLAANLLCGGPGIGNGDLLGANVATLRCEGGGCPATVAGNAISGGSGKLVVAVAWSNGGGHLDANAILAGCGGEGSTGVLLNAASARLTNNRILGGDCANVAAVGSFFGVRVVHASGSAEPDIHSNDIDPRGSGGACDSRGVLFERVSGQSAPNGILRNNIVAAGNCKNRTAIYENPSAAARVIENNDVYPGPLSPSSATTVLYRRGDTVATTVDELNGLAGAAANVSADPKFVAYPDDLHLTSESKSCIDKGTAVGAPPTDADGVTRPQGAGFDIGAYELVTH